MQDLNPPVHGQEWAHSAPSGWADRNFKTVSYLRLQAGFSRLAAGSSCFCLLAF